MGVLAIILNKAGVSLGWMYLAMGVLIGSAVIPIAFICFYGKKAKAFGAILGTVTNIIYGRVNLDTTGRNAPMLAGNLVSILTVCSFLNPQN